MRLRERTSNDISLLFSLGVISIDLFSMEEIYNIIDHRSMWVPRSSDKIFRLKSHERIYVPGRMGVDPASYVPFPNIMSVVNNMGESYAP